MNELGLETGQVLPWFNHEQETPYVLIRVSDEHARVWAEVLGVPVRRCYVADSLLSDRVAGGIPASDVVSAVLPDPGSTMAGDFGEVLVYVYLAAKENPQVAFGPKKWRLKQDRTKPAPHSDVVHFVLPSWPTATENDRLLCSEVKTKSTPGNYNPIALAIAVSAKDRISRLSKTLVWLREQAILGRLSNVTIEQLNRFINATEYPPYRKEFRAIAIICASLVDAELVNAPQQTTSEYTVIVISVPELQNTYERVFAAARDSVAQSPDANVEMPA